MLQSISEPVPRLLLICTRAPSILMWFSGLFAQPSHACHTIATPLPELILFQNLPTIRNFWSPFLLLIPNTALPQLLQIRYLLDFVGKLAPLIVPFECLTHVPLRTILRILSYALMALIFVKRQLLYVTEEIDANTCVPQASGPKGDRRRRRRQHHRNWQRRQTGDSCFPYHTRAVRYIAPAVNSSDDDALETMLAFLSDRDLDASS